MAVRVLRALELEAVARQVEVGVLEVEVGVLAGLEVGRQGQTQLGWEELKLEPQSVVQLEQLGMGVKAGKRQFLTLWGLPYLSVKTFHPVRYTIYLTWLATRAGIATRTSS